MIKGDARLTLHTTLLIQMMRVFYISTVFDKSASLYVGQLLGFPGCHSQGASINELLENLAEAIELVASQRPERISVYFDLAYQNPEAMLSKSILVNALRSALQNENLDEGPAAALLGVDPHVFAKVLRGVFSDTSENTIREWLGKTSPGALLFSAEVEQKDDGRWLADLLELTVMAYGQTPLAAVAAALRSAALGITDDEFKVMLSNGSASLLRMHVVVANQIKAHQESVEHGQRHNNNDLANEAAAGFGQQGLHEGHYSQVSIEGIPKEHDLVALAAASPAGRPAGALGIVVHVHRNSEAFEVEFNTEAGYSVETIPASLCQTVLLVNSVLQRWVSPISQKTGRPEQTILQDGLLASDFSGTGVRISFEDGSDLRFKNAFYVGDVANRIADKAVCRVGVFTEHVGHHEFWIGPEDQIYVDSQSCAGTSLDQRAEDFSQKPDGGVLTQVFVDHDVATIQEFKDNPQDAATYLCSVLSDGDPAGILLALRRIDAAFDSGETTALTRDYGQTVAARAMKEPAFAIALIDEAKALFLSGESRIGRRILMLLATSESGVVDTKDR